MDVTRTTFVIGKDGKIAKIFEKVKPEGHGKEVLECLKALWTNDVLKIFLHFQEI